MDVIYQNFNITGDGNCQYRAISYSLYKTENYFYIIKDNVIQYINDYIKYFKNYTNDFVYQTNFLFNIPIIF